VFTASSPVCHCAVDPSTELGYIPSAATYTGSCEATMQSLVEIKRNDTAGVTLRWEDGTVHSISSRTLREHCPSAVSKAKRGDTSHDAPLTSGPAPRKSLLRIVDTTADEQLSLIKVWPIGNYAIGMAWGDGHNSGIYPFDLLFELGEQEKQV